MDSFASMISANRGAFVALSVGSTVLAIALVALCPFVLLRLPADHFVQPRRHCSTAARVGRFLLGLVLVLLGIAMLVLPGQGVVAIAVGASLLGLPVERAIGRFMLHRPGVASMLNKLRVRAGRPPFTFAEPEPRDDPHPSRPSDRFA
jgi:hypothetical protein